MTTEAEGWVLYPSGMDTLYDQNKAVYSIRPQNGDRNVWAEVWCSVNERSGQGAFLIGTVHGDWPDDGPVNNEEVFVPRMAGQCEGLTPNGGEERRTMKGAFIAIRDACYKAGTPKEVRGEAEVAEWMRRLTKGFADDLRKWKS